MLGIISKQSINSAALSPLALKGNRDYRISHSSWAVVYGTDIFENDAISVIADADLYNLQELIGPDDAVQHDDAYLIGMLYLRYGLISFEKLRGPFSICIIDKKEQKIIVATDRFGIKPVVYYFDGETLIFGQRIKEIQALSQSRIDEIDYEAVVDYINLSAIPTPKTIFRNIKKLSPGYFLSVEKEKMRPDFTRYYDIEYSEEKFSSKYFLKKLPDRIEESVKAMLEYEQARKHRVGTFLSGGTDSSTVAGMLKKLSGHVKTFSIGFDEPGYNELGYARIAARHFDSEYYEYIVTPDDVLRALDVIADAYDEPFGNASAVPAYFCALLAKENGIDTLFAGDGGDEIFGGNERYAMDSKFSIYHKVPLFVRKGLLEPLISMLPSTAPFVERGRKYIKRANIPQPDRFYSYNPVIAFGKENIFSADFLSRLNGYDTLAWARDLYDGANTKDDLNRLLYIDMKFTITDNDLKKVTFMSEKAGINVCYPLLDHKLVDFASAIPASLKVKGHRLRYIFKKALRDFLPVEVIKKKKHGFGLPIGVWLRTKKKISAFAKECLLSSDCAIKPYFRKNFIENIFSMHDATKAVFYGDVIWFLLIFELWHKRWKQNGS